MRSPTQRRRSRISPERFGPLRPALDALIAAATTDLRHVECFAVHARWGRCSSSTPFVRAAGGEPEPTFAAPCLMGIDRG